MNGSKAKSDNYSVFIAELKQETNTFLPVPTCLVDFKIDNYILRGNNAVIKKYTGTNTVLGGFIAGCKKFNLKPAFSVAASAQPGGIVQKEAYEKMRDYIIEDLKQKAVDGVIISLHGAMVAEGYDDPEGDILKAIKELVGQNVPVVGVLDLHANVSKEMVDNTEMLLVYNTYPHVDTGNRGMEAVEMIKRIITKQIRPKVSWVKIPALLISLNMRTDIPQGPMTKMIALAQQEEQNKSVLDVSIAGGFPYADIPFSGAAVICTTDSDKKLAKNIANRFAKILWDLKDEFDVNLTPPEEAFEKALKSDKRAVVLADIADNPQSGGSGDTTTLLKKAIDKGVRDIIFAIFYDPETVAKAVKLGMNGKSHFHIGGKVYPPHGGPCEVNARVINISDGKYVKKGPMERGVKASMGCTAVLEVQLEREESNAKAPIIVVSECRLSTNDPEMLNSLNIDPKDFKILVLKAKGHFRAAFKPIVSEIIDVDAPGFSSLNLKNYDFKKINRPVWPLDDIKYSNEN